MATGFRFSLWKYCSSSPFLCFTLLHICSNVLFCFPVIFSLPLSRAHSFPLHFSPESFLQKYLLFSNLPPLLCISLVMTKGSQRRRMTWNAMFPSPCLSRWTGTQQDSVIPSWAGTQAIQPEFYSAGFTANQLLTVKDETSLKLQSCHRGEDEVPRVRTQFLMTNEVTSNLVHLYSAGVQESSNEKVCCAREASQPSSLSPALLQND